VPKVILQSITKPTRAFLRSIVLKDWLWHNAELPGRCAGLQVICSQLFRNRLGVEPVTQRDKPWNL